MQSNVQSHILSNLRKYVLFIFVITGICSYTSIQNNKPDATNNTEEQTSTPAQLQTDQKSSELSFEDFLSALEREQQLEIDRSSTNELSVSNHGLPNENHSSHKEKNEAQILQKKSEYQQLIEDFNQVEGDDKVHLLEGLWRLAPEVGIDDNLLTLLQLTIYSPDIRIREIASKMLSDLKRYKDGELTPEEQLVSQIMEINNYQKKLTESSENDTPKTVDQLKFDNPATDFEMTQQKNEKIDQLTKLALTSENIETKEYALINLVQLDHVSALNIIQHQLLNSKNSDERFRAIEHLRSSIGSFDDNKIRQILEMASNDYDTVISENASNTLEMLANYLQMQNNPAESDLNRPEIQLNPDDNGGDTNHL